MGTTSLTSTTNTRDTFPRPTLLQPHNHTLQNTAVSLHIEEHSPLLGVRLTVGILLQALRAAADGRVEDHWRNMPHPVEGAAGTGRPQDPLHVNVADHGRGDYRPLPLNVSVSHPGLLLTNITRATGHCGPRHIPWYGTSRCPCSRPTQYPSEH